MEELDWLRSRIDEIDPMLLALFLERMDVCKKVGEVKKAGHLPVYDAQRERDILAGKLTGITDPEHRRLARAFFTCLMDLSKEYQLSVMQNDHPAPKEVQEQIGYCGIPGAFGHEAAVRYFHQDNLLGLSSFRAVAEAVVSGNCRYGVLPIENSTYGSVLEVYDLFSAYPIYIVGEVYLPIRHCLLGTGELASVKSVLSHPQALHQCSRFLEEGGYALLEAGNTAVAAKEVAERKDPALAAIGSAHCGELYGLSVLKDNITNHHRNYTRFVIIGRELEHQQDYEKVSLTFDLPHEEGALYKILDSFKQYNLTKIESRPKGEWEYSFYLDFEGGEISAIINKIANAKILGLYQKGDK